MPTNRDDDQRLVAVDRMIEGRLELINRLFDDVRDLTVERDRIAGRRVSLLSRLRERNSIPR